MKSIFKKIALVLALAMVVTMLPAKSVSVSAADASANKWTRKTCTLYVDSPVVGDKDGIYVSSAYATAKTKVADPEGWKTEGYSVVFTTDDATVASVGPKYGLVEAVGIGQTTITATYSKAGAADVVESFPVTVKRSAIDVALDEETAKAVDELVVGADPIALKAVMTDADGNSEVVEKTANDGGKLSELLSEGRKFVTDYLKYDVKNPEGKDVIKVEDNKLTAVAEGDATLVVKAYRYDWQSWGKTKSKYVKVVTVQKEIPVTVKEAGIVKAEQNEWNAFQITFDTDDVAKTAAEKTAEYFKSATAAVTDQDDIVTVYEVVKDAQDKKIPRAVIIGAISQDDTVKNIVNVTMFEELKQKTEYIVSYKGKSVSFTTAENVATEISITKGTSERTNIDGNSSKTKIELHIYTRGENGQLVKLDGCTDYIGWDATVTLEEIGGEQYHPDYYVSLNPKDPYVDFYTDDQKVSVTVRATFLDYFNNKEKPGNPLTHQVTIKAGDYTTMEANIVAYGVHNVGSNHNTDGIYSSQEFAAEDYGRRLFVKLEIHRNGATETHYSEDEVGSFTFRSANEDKLIIDERTGELFPPKKPSDGTVNVFIYYDGELIGARPIKVWEKRQLTYFTAEFDGSSQLSYNPTNGINDTLKLKLTPKDQLGDVFPGAVVNVEPLGATDAYVNTTTTQNGDGTWTTTITGKDLPANQSRSIRLLCTAVYEDGLTKETRTTSVTFSAKNTTGATVSRYTLDAKTSLDMELGDADGKRLSDKVVTIEAYGIDREGFKINKLDIAPLYDKNAMVAGQNYISIQHNNAYFDDTLRFKQGSDSKRVVLETVIPKNADVVSGSAISGSVIPANVVKQVVTPVTGAAISQMSLLEKMEVGSYQVSLYVANDANSKAVFRTGSVLRVTDEKSPVTWNWKQYSVEGASGTVGDVVAAIQDAFEFKLGDDPINIYVGKAELDKNGAPTGNVDLSDDIVVRGSSITVRQVRCLITYNDSTYELLIPINKTIVVK